MARRAYLDHLRIDAASGFASWLCFLVPVRSERAPVTADTHRLLRTVRPFWRGRRGHAVGARREM